MTERLRKILRGSKLTPMTADEAAVKIAVDNAGGGGDEYETVAEIEVGAMTEQGGLYMYQPENVPFPTDLTPNDKLYWGEYPLENESTNVYFYNIDIQTMQPTGNPAYVLQVDRETGVVEVIMSDTDISNTTIRILKMVSGGSSITVDSALSDTSENPVQNKVITAALEDAKPLIVQGTWADGNPSTVTITTPLADIYAAADAGRAVFLEYANDGETTRMGMATREESNGEYTLAFSIGILMSGKPAVAAVEFANSLVGEFAFAVGQ